MISAIIALAIALGGSLSAGVFLFLELQGARRLHRWHEARFDLYQRQLDRGARIVVAAGHADPGEVRTAINEFAGALAESPPALGSG